MQCQKIHNNINIYLLLHPTYNSNLCYVMKLVWKCACVITGTVRKSQHRYLLLISVFLSHSCPKVIIVSRIQSVPKVCFLRFGHLLEFGFTVSSGSLSWGLKDTEYSVIKLIWLYWHYCIMTRLELNWAGLWYQCVLISAALLLNQHCFIMYSFCNIFYWHWILLNQHQADTKWIMQLLCAKINFSKLLNWIVFLEVKLFFK